MSMDGRSFLRKKKINFYKYWKVFVVVYEVMARTKQTARRLIGPPKAKKVRKGVNPAYTSSVKGVENDDEPGVESYEESVVESDEESGVESDEESGLESDEESVVEPKVFKCQTPPVESGGVDRVDVWKCESYKNDRYDPMAKVPMKGEKVEPFLYGRVVVFKLKGNSGSGVQRLDVWKCERYKKYRYDPMAKVPMKGEKVKPFLYGRVVVFQLKGNSGSVVG